MPQFELVLNCFCFSCISTRKAELWLQSFEDLCTASYDLQIKFQPRPTCDDDDTTNVWETNHFKIPRVSSGMGSEDQSVPQNFFWFCPGFFIYGAYYHNSKCEGRFIRTEASDLLRSNFIPLTSIAPILSPSPSYHHHHWVPMPLPSFPIAIIAIKTHGKIKEIKGSFRNTWLYI